MVILEFSSALACSCSEPVASQDHIRLQLFKPRPELAVVGNPQKHTLGHHFEFVLERKRFKPGGGRAVLKILLGVQGEHRAV